MGDMNLEMQARKFIENELIPQVRALKKVTISFSDFMRKGLDKVISIVTGLVCEYGLCLKMSFGHGNSLYQFWYETE